MKLNQFQFLVFDWDGTLSDTSQRIIQAAHKACEELQIPAPETEEFRQSLGTGVDEIVRSVFPELTPLQAAQLVDRYRYHYFATAQEEFLFRGVEETLTALQARGFVMAVATNKSRKGLNRALLETKIADFFAATRTADESGAKPSPQMLHDLMELTGMLPEHTVMIGDSPVDLQLAENAGVASIVIHHDGIGSSLISEFKPLAVVTEMVALLKL